SGPPRAPRPRSPLAPRPRGASHRGPAARPGLRAAPKEPATAAPPGSVHGANRRFPRAQSPAPARQSSRKLQAARPATIARSMIIVTGTKRSGTSMWMQILKAAGFPILGEAFPRDWGETIRDANKQGFFESPLRLGIYYATNPHPRTGAFLAPKETRRLAVKVFSVGLVKSDLAYVDKVVASMRPWREYLRSLERL